MARVSLQTFNNFDGFNIVDITNLEISIVIIREELAIYKPADFDSRDHFEFLPLVGCRMFSS